MRPMADRHPYLALSIDGTELEDEALDALRRVSISRRVGVPDEFTLEVVDAGQHFFEAGLARLASSVTIAIRHPTGSTKILAGEVANVTVTAGLTPSYQIRGYDLSHRLTGGEIDTSYQGLTDGEIIEKVARRHGLSASTDPTQITHDYLLQTSSDFDFVTSRARQLGFKWWVENDTLHFKKDDKSDTVDAAWGEDISSIRAEASAAARTQTAAVRVWNQEDQRTIASTSDVRANAAALGTTARGVLDLFRGIESANGFDATDTTNTVVAATTQEAEALADGTARQAEASQLHISGELDGKPELKPGSQLHVQGAPGALDGTYNVVTVDHILEPSGFRTEFSAGPAPRLTLADVIADTRQSNDQAEWAARGLVLGKVTNVDDEQGLGRVRVKFPTLNDDDESSWARIVGAGAGPDRGLQVAPEVGDEVVLGFQHGDTRDPYILGGVWSRDVTAPIASADLVDQKEVQVRRWTSRLGHSISLHDGDKAADQAIIVALGDSKTVLRIGADGIELSTPNPITVTSDADISITAKGNFSVDAENIEFKAKSALTASGREATVSGQQKTSIGADGTSTEVAASGQLKMSSGGSASLQASMVQLN